MRDAALIADRATLSSSPSPLSLSLSLSLFLSLSFSLSRSRSLTPTLLRTDLRHLYRDIPPSRQSYRNVCWKSIVRQTGGRTPTIKRCFLLFYPLQKKQAPRMAKKRSSILDNFDVTRSPKKRDDLIILSLKFYETPRFSAFPDLLFVTQYSRQFVTPIPIQKTLHCLHQKKKKNKKNKTYRSEVLT